LEEHFKIDDAARIAALRLQGQLSARSGELREFVRRALEAEKEKRLFEPRTESAYYFAKQALAIDKGNAQALGVLNRLAQRAMLDIEQSASRGDTELVSLQIQQALRRFPEDRAVKTKAQEILSQQAERIRKKTIEPDTRRLDGLAKYRREEFREAIVDLEFAAENGHGSAEVFFALGRSYYQTGQPERAAHFLRKVPPTAGEAYVSAIALLADISADKGDFRAAIERYKEARARGGSALYNPGKLDDKIARTEQRLTSNERELPTVSIEVTHTHGVLRGSCRGRLQVSSTGVRYDAYRGGHIFVDKLAGVSVLVTKDDLKVAFNGKPQEFKATASDAEHFRAVLTNYQASRRE
jgi:tetratricopeptide (TPR) repeat protein